MLAANSSGNLRATKSTCTSQKFGKTPAHLSILRHIFFKAQFTGLLMAPCGCGTTPVHVHPILGFSKYVYTCSMDSELQDSKCTKMTASRGNLQVTPILLTAARTLSTSRRAIPQLRTSFNVWHGYESAHSQMDKNERDAKNLKQPQ